MKGNTGVLIRDVTKWECKWLEEDLIRGTVVFAYRGPTYGCLTSSGVAVLMDPNENVFIELPSNSILWD